MPIEIFSLVPLLCGDTNYSCTLLALGGKAASRWPGHNPFLLQPGCRACFQGCRPSGAQATCARGTCGGLRGSCLSTFIAAYRGSEAFTSLCVTSYLIIPSLFLLVNRFQICNGFDACIIRCGSSKPGLHPLGELAGRDGEYAACSPLILLPVAMNTRLFSRFLFSF